MINRDDIIRMAREAGIGWLERAEGITEFLERFANLVAAAELRRLHEENLQWQDKCNTYMELHDAVVKDSDRLYALNAELVEALRRMKLEKGFVCDCGIEESTWDLIEAVQEKINDGN